MYIDTDECEESRDINVLSCIRDVKFVNRNQFEQHYVNKPPFIMKNWIKGMPYDARVICTITYEVSFLIRIIQDIFLGLLSENLI